MKTNLLVVVIVGLALIVNVGISQDMGIFGGHGIGIRDSLEMDPVVPAAKNRWPKILDFSRDTTGQTERKPFSALFKKPNFELPKLGMPKLGMPKLGMPNLGKPAFGLPAFEKPSFNLFKLEPSEPGIVDRAPSLGDLFPKRDPNKPTFFQTMNEKSKNFLGKTSGWMTGKNNELKDKTNGTWDSVVSDFRSIQKEEGIAPTRPNVRTADATGKPRVRF